LKDSSMISERLNNTSNQLFKTVFFLYYFKIGKMIIRLYGANKFSIGASLNRLVEYHWRVGLEFDKIIKTKFEKIPFSQIIL
jgi:hypothetical protein